MIFKYLKIKLKKKFIINYKKFKKFEINLKIIIKKNSQILNCFYNIKCIYNYLIIKNNMLY